MNNSRQLDLRNYQKQQQQQSSTSLQKYLISLNTGKIILILKAGIKKRTKEACKDPARYFHHFFFKKSSCHLKTVFTYSNLVSYSVKYPQHLQTISMTGSKVHHLLLSPGKSSATLFKLKDRGNSFMQEF